MMNTIQTSKLIVEKSNFGSSSRKIKTMNLNFGPQHPAAHGILRLVFQMQGEFIQKIDTQFGLLHRGTEKLIESKMFIQSLPYFDRFDYVANIFQEHAYCLTIEKLLNTKKTFDLYLNYIRTLFDELSRILNHLLTLSATSLDVGAMGSIFWAFEERERIMEFFERLSGARMHTALYKPNWFDVTNLTELFFLDLSKFLLKCSRTVNGAFLGLLNNRILKSRLASVGSIQINKINNYGITGIIGRSGGVKDDLRLKKVNNYGSYWYLSFRTFLGKKGDNYDRFLIRIKEILESFRIISQILVFLNVKVTKKNLKSSFNSFVYKFKKTFINFKFNFKFIIKSKNYLFFLYFFFKKNINKSKNFYFNFQDFIYSNFINELNFKNKFSSMEEVITHFKYYSEGFKVPAGISYQNVESPKGYLGVFMVSDGSSFPYRCKVRTPVSHNMHLIPTICTGLMFADFVSTFCSLDIVLGEIDR